MPPKLSCICRNTGVPLCGKSLFCHGCKSEHEAMKKDATENGWVDKFEEGKADPVVFSKMVNDFRFECKSRVAGASARNMRLRALIRSSRGAASSRWGSERVMMDRFDFEQFYKAKRFSDTAIEEKWRDALANFPEDDKDMNGENIEWPERVVVVTKTFRLDFQQEAAVASLAAC